MAGYADVINIVIVVELLSFCILGLYHFLTDERGCEIRIKYHFIVRYFGKFLHEFNKVIVFNMQSSAITDHDHSRIKLTYLIEQEIFDYKSNEVTLMILDVLSCL